jgi:SRSO17 transposase
MILPLCFEVYKPRKRLKPGEGYQTKPQIAATMMHELIAMGFQFELVMSNAPAIKLDEIGDAYGERTWVEYGLKQSKAALGWADFRVTNYKQIECWWEIVMSAFTMASLFADVFNPECPLSGQVSTQHPWWDNQRGWKNLLNNSA